MPPGHGLYLYASTKHRFSVHTLLFGLDFDNFNALVTTTRGANLVWQAQFMALGTRDHIARLERMMASSPALAALAQLVFW